MPGPTTDPAVDEYLATLDEASRSSLQQLRETILAVVPDAEECISYGVPGYRLDGEVIAGFAAAKRHLSYLPHSGSVLAELAGELTGYDRSKGTLRFEIGSTLPRHLVERLVATRIALAGSGEEPR